MVHPIQIIVSSSRISPQAIEAVSEKLSEKVNRLFVRIGDKLPITPIEFKVSLIGKGKFEVTLRTHVASRWVISKKIASTLSGGLELAYTDFKENVLQQVRFATRHKAWPAYRR